MSKNQALQIDAFIRRLALRQAATYRRGRQPQAAKLSKLQAIIHQGQLLWLAWLNGQLDEKSYHVESARWFSWAEGVDDRATHRLHPNKAAVAKAIADLDEVWRLCGAAWDAALDLQTATYGADNAYMLRRSLFNYHALPIEQRRHRADIRQLLATRTIDYSTPKAAGLDL